VAGKGGEREEDREEVRGVTSNGGRGDGVVLLLRD